MAENKIFNKQKKKQNTSNNVTKKVIISTKHKLKSEKHRDKRRGAALKKSPNINIKKMKTNNCPWQGFYPTPANLVKYRSYIKKGIHPVDCSICQGGMSISLIIFILFPSNFSSLQNKAEF